MFIVHHAYAVTQQKVQSRGSSFRNGSESGDSFWSTQEGGEKQTNKKGFQTSC